MARTHTHPRTRLSSLTAFVAATACAAAFVLAVAGPAGAATPEQFASAFATLQNLVLRLSARPGADDAWELTFDTLYAPEDRGRIHTFGVSWQGDRCKAAFALRRSEGPAEAVFRQLPARTTAVLDAGWSF